MTVLLSTIIALLVYFLFTYHIQLKIESANYLDEDRRRLHKRLIWVIPFIGPQLIRSYWQKSKKQKSLEVKTKGSRKSEVGGFYESNSGIY
jgi:hypothetical protein